MRKISIIIILLINCCFLSACNKNLTPNLIENNSQLTTSQIHEHTYVTSKTSPTCIENGYTTYLCSSCGDTYKSDYTIATGHTYSIQYIKATTKTQGYSLHTCSNCGDTYNDDFIALIDPVEILSTYMNFVDNTNERGGKYFNKVTTNNGSVITFAISYNNDNNGILSMALAVIATDAVMTINIDFPAFQSSYNYTAIYYDTPLGEVNAKGIIEANTFNPNNDIDFTTYSGKSSVLTEYKTIVSSGIDSLLKGANTLIKETGLDITITDFGFSYYG